MHILTLGESIRIAVNMLEGDLSADSMSAVIPLEEWTSVDIVQMIAGFAFVARSMATAAGTEQATAVFAEMRALSYYI